MSNGRAPVRRFVLEGLSLTLRQLRAAAAMRHVRPRKLVAAPRALLFFPSNGLDGSTSAFVSGSKGF